MRGRKGHHELRHDRKGFQPAFSPARNLSGRIRPSLQARPCRPCKGGSMGRMPMEQEPQNSGETEPGRPSKSALKREASSLQELGVKLSSLPDQEIKELDLPDNLFVALCDLKRLPSHGAQVRQRQYIGKLMRNIEPAPGLAKRPGKARRSDSE